ncbi:hypothetical protein [Streptomyces angustmyceticus]|uniref:hypothetical protein n=1 Tax=Streptomyces angustmyceticus TaxID=285578 RepID=UPI003D924FD8
MRDRKINRIKTGDFTGQLVAGDGNKVVSSTGGPPPAPGVDHDELEALRAEFALLRDRLAALDDPQSGRGAERLAELEEAVADGEPDVPVMVYVRGWFARQLPALAGAVTSLIVHPVVGRLVQQAGDGVVAEFRRHFGEEGAG